MALLASTPVRYTISPAWTKALLRGRRGRRFRRGCASGAAPGTGTAPGMAGAGEGAKRGPASTGSLPVIAPPTERSPPEPTSGRDRSRPSLHVTYRSLPAEVGISPGRDTDTRHSPPI